MQNQMREGRCGSVPQSRPTRNPSVTTHTEVQGRPRNPRNPDSRQAAGRGARRGRGGRPSNTRRAKADSVVGSSVADWEASVLGGADASADRKEEWFEEKVHQHSNQVPPPERPLVSGVVETQTSGKDTNSGVKGSRSSKPGHDPRLAENSVPGPPNGPGDPPGDDNPGGGGPNGPGGAPMPRAMNEVPYVAGPVLPDQQAAPVDPYAGLRARAKAHFLVSGYSDKALQSAASKMLLWLSRSGVNDSNLDLNKVDDASQIIWEAFKSRATLGTWWQRIKLQVYDWFVAQCTPQNVFYTVGIATAVGTLTTLALGYFRPKKAMAVLTAAAACIGISWHKNRPKLGVYPCPKLADYCTRTSTVDAPIAQGASVTITAQPKCVRCEFAVGFTTAPHAVWIPRLCTHNELNALVYRQLLPALSDPATRRRLWKIGCDQLLQELPPMMPQDLQTPEERFEFFLAKYPVRRRDQIRNEYQRKNQSFLAPECNTAAFVKREWLVGKALNKRNPRLISGKSDGYLAETGPDYYCFQKEMCKRYWNEISAFSQKYIYTGGMTGDQIGALFSQFVLSRGWEVIEGDYSRYDGHNEQEAIEAEMEYYAPVLCEDVRTHLLLQTRTEGRTGGGHKFKCIGKVASGVINTSFGNTIRGFMILSAYESCYGYKDWAVMQLGDDNVIFAKDVVAFNLPRLVEFAAAMGHKLEAIHRPDPDFAEYCSQRFWKIGDTYVLGPKPGRVLAKTFICHDASLSTEDMPEYCRGVAAGFQHYTWIPVLSIVVQKLLGMPTGRISRNVQAALARMREEQYHKITLRTQLDVDLSAVYSQFLKIYGFDARDLERDLRGWNCEFGVAIQHELLDELNKIDGVSEDSINYVDLFNASH